MNRMKISLGLITQEPLLFKMYIVVTFKPKNYESSLNLKVA